MHSVVFWGRFISLSILFWVLPVVSLAGLNKSSIKEGFRRSGYLSSLNV